MSEAKHTPLPWSAGGPVDRDSPAAREFGPLRATFWEIGGPADLSPPGVAAVNSEADAQLIVTAVNCHADLLAACEGLLAGLLRASGECRCKAARCEKRDHLAAARAAIAKAKGESP